VYCDIILFKSTLENRVAPSSEWQQPYNSLTYLLTYCEKS